MAEVEGIRASDRQHINKQYRVLKVYGSVFTLLNAQGLFIM